MNSYGRSDELAHAKWQQNAFALPEYTYQAWRSQYHSAKHRGIPFKFTLFAWHQWWQCALAKIGPDAKRGLRKGQYMMCRHGDAGAYEDGNVFAGTAQQNHDDLPLSVQHSTSERMIGWHATHDCHLIGKRGDSHPKSKPIMTPRGRFGSMALAAEAWGISRQGMKARVDRGEPGYSYL